jgi:hypothetical protein
MIPQVVNKEEKFQCAEELILILMLEKQISFIFNNPYE